MLEQTQDFLGAGQPAAPFNEVNNDHFDFGSRFELIFLPQLGWDHYRSGFPSASWWIGCVENELAAYKPGSASRYSCTTASAKIPTGGFRALVGANSFNRLEHMRDKMRQSTFDLLRELSRRNVLAHPDWQVCFIMDPWLFQF
jgi:hypothetical protein